MHLLQGDSRQTDAQAAVAEATLDWPPGAALDLLLAFCSTRQDPHLVASSLAAKFPGVPVIGCTTAGEHIAGRHSKGSLVLTGLRAPHIRFRTAAVEDIGGFNEESARKAADELLAKLGVHRDELSPAKHFCLTFMDGLSRKEEAVSALMADELGGIPLIGGSAGDDLRFERTHVFHEGRALSGAAVFAIAESDLPFEVVKHQHYTTTPRSLVITRADVPSRRVIEMDGYPALEAYARALRMRPSDITSDVTSENPLTFVCDNKIYVRSVQRIEADGSMVFYCGIEEGMVLSIGGHEDMGTALARDLAAPSTAPGPADLFIVFNCILRALEADKGCHHEELGDIAQRFGGHVIGFDTYGEQLGGLHINQTLVGIVLRGAAPSAS